MSLRRQENEAAITTHEVGGARTETAGPTARARGREEELIAELESARRRVEELELEIEQLQEANAAESLRLQEEVSGLLAELDAQLAMRKIAGSNYIIRVSISE